MVREYVGNYGLLAESSPEGREYYERMESHIKRVPKVLRLLWGKDRSRMHTAAGRGGVSERTWLERKKNQPTIVVMTDTVMKSVLGISKPATDRRPLLEVTHEGLVYGHEQLGESSVMIQLAREVDKFEQLSDSDN